MQANRRIGFLILTLVPVLAILSVNSIFTRMLNPATPSLWGVTLAASEFTVTKLTADDPAAAVGFGAAVALSDTLAFVGAPGAAGAMGETGAVYLFAHEGADWQAAGKLTASDGEALDFFGRSIARHDDLLVIGANGDDDAGSNAGAAYLFQRSAQGWVEIAKLTPSTAGVVSAGWSVATDGTTVVVGARNRSSQGEIINTGVVHVYEVVGDAWAEVAQLSSGASGGAVLSDLFGSAVAVQGNTIVVGAPNGNCVLGNCLYLYARDEGQWAAAGNLAGSDTLPGDRFGSALAINEDWLLVGASGKGETGSNVGAAYLFAHDGVAWQEVTKVTPSRALLGSRFGAAVALSADWAAVGAPESEGSADRNESGAVYLFHFTETEWQAAAELSADDAAALDHFGQAVAVSSAYALSGAPDADLDTAVDAGAAYTFILSPEDGVPTPTATHTPDPNSTPPPATATPTILPTTAPEQPHSRDCEAMSVSEQSREHLSSDAVATWSSSFHCVEAPAAGPYALTVTVAYTGSAGSALLIDEDGVHLTHTTPRPLGQAPTATMQVSGLPLVVPAGGVEQFMLQGMYELVTVGAGKKANLHFCVTGQLQGSDTPFELGVNAHLRNMPGPQASDNVGPPIISVLQVTPGFNSATVRWQTDQPTTSRIVVGVGPQMNNAVGVSNGCTRTQDHSVTVQHLQPATDYSFQVVARSDEGLVASSVPVVFSTQSAAVDASYLPLIQR